MRFFKRLVQQDEGTTAVEYAVMLSLIIAVCLAAIVSVGSETSAFMDSNASQLDSAIND